MLRTTGPDGRTAVLAFTSGLEAYVHRGGGPLAITPASELVAHAREHDLGLVIDPAGPWAALTPEELAAL